MKFRTVKYPAKLIFALLFVLITNSWANAGIISIKFTLDMKYQIADGSFTRLAVYDILGKEVVTLINADLSAGQHEVEFNAANLPSGVYLYRLTAGSYSACKKLMLQK